MSVCMFSRFRAVLTVHGIHFICMFHDFHAYAFFHHFMWPTLIAKLAAAPLPPAVDVVAAAESAPMSLATSCIRRIASTVRRLPR